MFSEYANEQIKSSLNLENDFEMYSLDNLLANDNKNYNLNFSLESNPPVVDLLLSENQPLSNEKDLPSSIEQNYERDSSDTIDSLVENIRLNKKRGRKNDKIEAQHTLFKNDCKMAKIQRGYFTFLILFLNKIMNLLKLNYSFIDLSGNYKSNINQKNRAILNKKTIKDAILEAPISGRNKKKNQNYNKDVYNRLKQENQIVLLNILDKNFLYFFEKIYYANVKKVDLSPFGLFTEIELKNDIKLFNNLLNKYKDDNINKYKFEMDRCARNYFFLK